MDGSTTAIPSIQMGAGVPLTSSAPTYAQSSFQGSAISPNMAPVQVGSIMQVPPGTMVPVKVGGSIVHVPTQPVQQAPQYQVHSVPVPTQTQEYVPPMENIFPAPQYQHLNAPTIKTLPPKIVRNNLPPQHKQVMLPPKIVQQRLPPLGPLPTPQLNIPQMAPPVPVPAPMPVPVQPIQSVMVPQQIPTIQVPVQSYAPATSVQLSTPNFGTTSVTQVVPQF